MKEIYYKIVEILSKCKNFENLDFN